MKDLRLDHGNRLNPNHDKTRNKLRTLGKVFVTLGGLCMVAAIGDFALAFGSSRMPKLFFLGFLGMPLLFAGSVMIKLGYLGAVARYVSSEASPVAADTIDYMTGETKGSVKDLAAAVAAGLSQGGTTSSATVPCPKCKTSIDPSSAFCSSCGTKLSKTCHRCQTANDLTASYCDKCGNPVS